MLLESQPLSDSGEAFWAPGAMEGTMMYHFGVGSEEPNAAQILAALQMAIAKPGVKTM